MTTTQTTTLADRIDSICDAIDHAPTQRRADVLYQEARILFASGPLTTATDLDAAAEALRYCRLAAEGWIPPGSCDGFHLGACDQRCGL